MSLKTSAFFYLSGFHDHDEEFYDNLIKVFYGLLSNSNEQLFNIISFRIFLELIEIVCKRISSYYFKKLKL
jgi:hypothetical protein